MSTQSVYETRRIDARRRGADQTDPTAELQAEVLSWDSRKATETLDHRSCESVAFTGRRQLYELGRSASSAPKIDEARAELLDTNGVLRIPISPSADDEFPRVGIWEKAGATY